MGWEAGGGALKIQVAAGGSVNSGTEQQRTGDRLQEDECQAKPCLGAKHLKSGKLEDPRGKEGIPAGRRGKPLGLVLTLASFLRLCGELARTGLSLSHQVPLGQPIPFSWPVSNCKMGIRLKDLGGGARSFQ